MDSCELGAGGVVRCRRTELTTANARSRRDQGADRAAVVRAAAARAEVRGDVGGSPTSRPGVRRRDLVSSASFSGSERQQADDLIGLVGSPSSKRERSLI